MIKEKRRRQRRLKRLMIALAVLAVVIELDLTIFSFKLWVLERDMEPVDYYPPHLQPLAV